MSASKKRVLAAVDVIAEVPVGGVIVLETARVESVVLPLL